jgi:hypothetical protein
VYQERKASRYMQPRTRCRATVSTTICLEGTLRANSGRSSLDLCSRTLAVCSLTGGYNGLQNLSADLARSPALRFEGSAGRKPHLARTVRLCQADRNNAAATGPISKPLKPNDAGPAEGREENEKIWHPCSTADQDRPQHIVDGSDQQQPTRAFSGRCESKRDPQGCADLIQGAGWMEAGMDGQAVIDGPEIASARCG